MKRKFAGFVAAFAMAISMSFSGLAFTSVNAYAADNLTIQVTKSDIEDEGFKSAVNSALAEASEAYDEDGKTRTVKVAQGTYNITHTIQIPSNVTVDFTGVTVTRDGGDNMIFIGEKGTADSGKTGYYTENIKIIGGVFDCSADSATGFKVAHVKNFTMEGVTITNIDNGHLMEVAACDGLYLTNCTFSDQISNIKGDNHYEAVQLDVLAKAHFNNYRLEALPIKNVYVTGCTFKNVPRGIGSHTAILNAPFTNINIVGNTFTSCSSIAVQGCNWQNVTIKDNTITKTPRGFALYTVNTAGSKNASYGTFLASTIDSQGDTKSGVSNKFIKSNTSKNITIEGNTITLDNSKDPNASYERMAIMISGSKVKSSKLYGDKSGTIPKGLYSIEDVTIKNNKIVTGGHGIRTVYAKNVTIENNTITRTSNPPTKDKNSPVHGNVYGIHVTTYSSSVKVIGNTINKNFTNGIYVNTKASATKITNNKIYSVKRRGISVENATAKTITGNTVKGAKQFGINLTVNAKATTIKNNTLKNCKKKKVNISGNIKVKTVKNN